MQSSNGLIIAWDMGHGTAQHSIAQRSAARGTSSCAWPLQATLQISIAACPICFQIWQIVDISVQDDHLAQYVLGTLPVYILPAYPHL